MSYCKVIGGVAACNTSYFFIDSVGVLFLDEFLAALNYNTLV